jgi:hypothetical protein
VWKQLGNDILENLLFANRVTLGVGPHPNENAPLVGLKGLDDITRDENGILYPVANGMGELLRVDPATGEACLIASGFQNSSSVRIAPHRIGLRYLRAWRSDSSIVGSEKISLMSRCYGETPPPR